jgi:acyl-CoA thioesterase-1
MLTRTRILVWILAAWILACSPEPPSGRDDRRAAAATAETAAPVMVAMGDSLTAGYGLDPEQAYPALLEARLRAEGHRWRVINAGISGETSSGALSRADWVIERLQPRIVILVTGANDGLRGIDPDLVGRNLRALVRRFQKAGALVILGGMRMVANLGGDYTAAFEALYPAVARETGAVLIPFFLEGVAGDPRLNQADGIHPTAEGYERIVAHIYPAVLGAVARKEK